MVRIIGGGLAGVEAAWQVASRGHNVTLYEMRPIKKTHVHKTDRLAELVCSNSFRGNKLENAVGLLKEEMRRLGSLVMDVASETSVPAGSALAVDRDQFAKGITETIEEHPLITICREEILKIPKIVTQKLPVIIATGPLTSDELSKDISSLVGQDHLYFYDAISPIVVADSIDRSKVFRASRWENGEEGDYLNCPLNEKEYLRLHSELISAERAEVHDFDHTKFFEGCLPIEVMAHRGLETLRFGPMKPVGLMNPVTGRRPYAVVQLRQDTLAADHYSLVGFQTQLKWGEQSRILRLIPGLETAEFVRYGMIHRNTYINAPTILRDTWQVRGRPGLFFAGQIAGVEGYVESAASGLMAGLHVASLIEMRPLVALPRTTAMGTLAYYVSHANSINYQPTNVVFGLFPSLSQPTRNKQIRRQRMVERALHDLTDWSKTCAKQEDERLSSGVS